MAEQNLDNTTQGPAAESGQSESSAQNEGNLEDAIKSTFEEKPQEEQQQEVADDSNSQQDISGEEVNQEVEESATESNEETLSEDYLNKKVEVGGKEMTVKNVLKSYNEAQKKISQKSDLEKQAEQMQKAMQQNPNLKKALQLAAQDNDFHVLVDAYEKGLIKKGSLQKAKKMLGTKSKKGSNNPQYQQLQQQVQNLQKQVVLNQIKTEIEEDYQQIANKYSNIVNEQGLDQEKLAETAMQHNFIKDGTKHTPDMEKALIYQIAQDGTALEKLQNMGRNEVKKTQQQKQQSKVETSSNKQNQTKTEKSLDQQMGEMIANANAPASGGI